MPTNQDTDCGRCITCGFLALRIHGSTLWQEMTVEHRNRSDSQAMLANPNDPSTAHVSAHSGCFRSLADIPAEVGSNPTERAHAKGVYDKDRKCQGWLRHDPGFGPKEHAERQAADATEKSRRDWEEKQAKSQQAFMTNLEKERNKDAARTRRFDIGIAIVGVILSAVTAAQIFTSCQSPRWPNDPLRIKTESQAPSGETCPLHPGQPIGPKYDTPPSDPPAKAPPSPDL